MYGFAFGALPLSLTKSQHGIGFAADAAELAGRIELVDDDYGTAIPFSLITYHLTKHAPTGIRD